MPTIQLTDEDFQKRLERWKRIYRSLTPDRQARVDYLFKILERELEILELEEKNEK